MTEVCHSLLFKIVEHIIMHFHDNSNISIIGNISIVSFFKFYSIFIVIIISSSITIIIICFIVLSSISDIIIIYFY